MNEIQKERVEKVKDSWARSLCVYDKIVEKDGVVFMVLPNGTAFTIDERGHGNWVVKGWEEEEEEEYGICPQCGKKAYVNDDHASPDSGSMGGHCDACDYSWSSILY